MKCIISILMIIIGRMQRCLEKDVATILFCLEGLRVWVQIKRLSD